MSQEALPDCCILNLVKAEARASCCVGGNSLSRGNGLNKSEGLVLGLGVKNRIRALALHAGTGHGGSRTSAWMQEDLRREGREKVAQESTA